MITVNQAVNVAAVGPLATHVLGEEGATDANIDKWLTLLNLALTDLHGRFPLRVRDNIIQQHDSISRYRLTADFAATNTSSTEPVKYIQDTATNPFDPRFLRIDSVWDAYGQKLPLNNGNHCMSVFTPEYNLLQIPDPSSDSQVSVVFRLPHDEVKVVTDAATTVAQTLLMPEQYLKPLTLFMASQAYSSMGSEQGILGLNYMQQYERACDEIQNRGLYNANETTIERFTADGWV